MESRKIQEVGGGTYTVSLPKDWAVEQGVSAGSVVNLHRHADGLLAVQAGEDCDDAFDRVVVECPPEASRRVDRVLRAAYGAGAEEVVLTSTTGFTTEEERAVEAVTRTLTGVTVESVTAERISVRTMLDPGEVSIRQSVRQLQFVALSTHREATAALVDGAAVDDPRPQGGDRLFALVDRHFERALARLDEVDSLGLDRPALFALWTTARELSAVAAAAGRIAAVANARDGALAADHATAVAELSSMARDVVDDAVEFVVGDADPCVAFAALDRRDRVRDEVDAFEQTLFAAQDADYRLTRVLDGVVRTAECGGTVAARGIRRAVRNGRLAAGDGGSSADVGSADAD